MTANDDADGSQKTSTKSSDEEESEGEEVTSLEKKALDTAMMFVSPDKQIHVPIASPFNRVLRQASADAREKLRKEEEAEESETEEEKLQRLDEKTFGDLREGIDDDDYTPTDDDEVSGKGEEDEEDENDSEGGGEETDETTGKQQRSADEEEKESAVVKIKLRPGTKAKKPKPVFKKREIIDHDQSKMIQLVCPFQGCNYIGSVSSQRYKLYKI